MSGRHASDEPLLELVTYRKPNDIFDGQVVRVWREVSPRVFEVRFDQYIFNAHQDQLEEVK